LKDSKNCLPCQENNRLFCFFYTVRTHPAQGTDVRPLLPLFRAGSESKAGFSLLPITGLSDFQAGLITRLILGLDFRFFFFSFRQLFLEDNVPVIPETGSGRDQPTHDNVFLDLSQVINFAVQSCLGQNPGGFLEGGSGDKAVGAQGTLGNPQKEWTGLGRLPAFSGFSRFFLKLELIDLLVHQEFSVTDFFNLNPAQHLSDDDLNMFIVDANALQAVYFLDFP